MTDAIPTALAGIQAGLRTLDRGAAKVASAGSADEIASGAIDLTEARTAVRANTAVLRIADRTIGSLLDLFA